MRWGVVSTLLEPAPMVFAFVAHYLSLGAARMDLYFDAPNPALEAEIGKLPGCYVHQKPFDTWAKKGRFGPPSPPQRQAINAQECYESAEVDWLLHVDADEFLYPAQTVISALEQQPNSIDYLALAPLERVLVEGQNQTQIFDGVFRRVVPNAKQAAVDKIYGARGKFLDFGLSSNGRAKCFCRTGRDLILGLHQPQDHSGNVAKGVMFDDPVLLHFDGMTERHYLAKLDRKISQNAGWRSFPAPGRRAQLFALHAAKGDQQARHQVYLAAKCVNASQAKALVDMDLLQHSDFDPKPALNAIFPDHNIDHSWDHFDSFALTEMTLPWYWRLWNSVKGRSFKLRQKFRKDTGPASH